MIFFPFFGATMNINYINSSSQSNILINNETPARACISDFGLCAIAPDVYFGPTAPDVGGTFGYMAPELFSEGAKPSKEVDIYTFGILVYEVVTGARAFEPRRAEELLPPIPMSIRPHRPEDPVAIGFGQGTWEFAEKCWNGNREKRPTAREALEHFKRVVRTSIAVDPGPKVPVYGAAGEVPPRFGRCRGSSQCLL